ncbi:hypothetical protein HPB49_006681 [Dermacentor silvarum]|uniref:Uncharacterized protein n=1 Tax=Dermacentor silvarum TaxID=543639 RepID=A0ACB8CVP9_DERSI|nr:hypothetical protein HPB49_006681 [Dermacentor silvarum]
MTNRREDRELSSSDLNTLRMLFRDVKYIIVGEKSMLSSDLLRQVDMRLREIRDSMTESLEGFDVIFCEDLRQLPPVRAGAIQCPMAVRLFFSNKDVDAYNRMVAESCEYKHDSVAMHVVTGHWSRQEEREALARIEDRGRVKSGNLPSVVTFCTKRPYMLLKNIYVMDALVNGMVGTLMEVQLNVDGIVNRRARVPNSDTETGWSRVASPVLREYASPSGGEAYKQAAVAAEIVNVTYGRPGAA